MKVFGTELFKREPKILYNFAQHGLIRNVSSEINEYVAMIPNTKGMTGKRKKKKEEPKNEITPKELYQLQTLNDNDFKISYGVEYLDKAIADCKRKLALMPKDLKHEWEPGAAMYG